MFFHLGSAKGTNIQTANSFFNFILPILNECCSLVNVYHNYQQIIELILQLFYEIANDALCFLTEVCKLIYSLLLFDCMVIVSVVENIETFAKIIICSVKVI